MIPHAHSGSPPPRASARLIAVGGHDAALAFALSIAALAALGIGYVTIVLPYGPRGHGPLPELLLGMSGYFALLGAVDFACVRRRAASWRDFGLRAVPRCTLLLSAGASVVCVAVTAIVHGLFGIWDAGLAFGRDLVAQFLDHWWGLPGLLLLAGPLAAAAEEALFRGVLYRWLSARLGILPGALVSAAVFAAMHVPPFLAGDMATLAAVPLEIGAMGVALALLFEATGSLWPPIVLHASYNVLVLLLYTFG